jgi:site-specific recombinase XerD
MISEMHLQSPITAKGLLNEYEQDHIYTLSKGTLNCYLADIKNFISTLEGVYLLDATDKEITAYRKRLSQRKNSASTQCRKLSALRHFYLWLEERGYIEYNPFKYIFFPKKEKKLPRFMSYDEVNNVISAAYGDKPNQLRDGVILELLYASGIRVSEAVNIRIDCMDVDRNCVKVTGKGGNERFVLFHDKCAQKIREYLAVRPSLVRGVDNGLLFLNKFGKRLSRQHVFRLVKQCAGDKASPHTFRHSFATHLLEGGMDIVSISELLGHAKLDTTSIYTHLADSMLRREVRQRHPRLARIYS